MLGAYEWGLGDKTKKANAALAGLGATRRILVSDTMLADYSDDEIEVVLAHELAHHVHGDIWKGIVFESALIVGGLLPGVAGAGRVDRRGLGFAGSADLAGLPLLLLAAGAVSLVMLPAAHAMSRAFERSADRFALDLTRNPDGVHLGDAPARRRRTSPRSIRRESSSGCSTAIRRCATASPPRRRACQSESLTTRRHLP